MKKILIPLLLLIVAGACKKDGASGRKLLLSKVFVNNLLSEEYLYASDNKPVRKNLYNTSLGQSTYSGFKLYEYANGVMTKELRYNKDYQLSARQGFTWNTSDQLTRVDYYGTDDVIDNYFLFVYENNLLTGINSYTAAPVKKTNEVFLKYDATGRLVSIKRYYLSGNNWLLFDSATIAPSAKPLPAHLQYSGINLLEFPSERTFLQMQTDSMYYYLSGGPPTKANHAYTQKVYNGAGYLTSQHYKLVADNGIGLSTYESDLKYEYIE